MNSCKMCGSNINKIKDSQFDFTYDYCPNCHFISKNFVLNSVLEKKEYQRHNNSIDNLDYVNYFTSLIDNYFLKYLDKNTNILDYGSGPYPILKEILHRDYDISIYNYDLYFNDIEFDKLKYSTIITTEVIEHIKNPLKTLDKLISILEDNGVLIIMTLFHNNNLEVFNDWWYRRDPTHISFFDKHTFLMYINAHSSIRLEFTDNKRIIILRKV